LADVVNVLIAIGVFVIAQAIYVVGYRRGMKAMTNLVADYVEKRNRS
jgi:hypothetical protein